jgi:flagella synthesis protein FlgN
MSELIKAIKIQFDHLEQLKLVLENEIHLISSRDPESLINLLKEKEHLLNLVQAQDELINSEYQKTPESNKTKPEVQDLFTQMKDLVSQCQHRTKINQTAVEQGQLRLEHLRNLLLESRAKESITYDKNGRTQGSNPVKGISA